MASMRVRRLAGSCAVVLLLLAGPSRAQDDTLNKSKAITFDGEGNISPGGNPKSLQPFPLNPRLEMTLECSIELWIKLDDSYFNKPQGADDTWKSLDQFDKPVCVLACTAPGKGNNPGKPLWGVYFTRDGFYLSEDGAFHPPVRLSNDKILPGRFPFSMPIQGVTPVDWRGRPTAPFKMTSDWQHIVLAISGYSPSGVPLPAFRVGQTTNFFQLPNPTGGGRTLTIGSGAGGSNFKGSIGTIRFWERVLTADQIKWLADSRSFDLPGKDCPARPYLLAHWSLSGSDPEGGGPEYVAPRINVEKFHGGANGTSYFSRRPLGTEPKAFFATFTATDTRHLRTLQVEYDAPGPWVWGFRNDRRGPRYRYSAGIPVVLPDYDSARANEMYAAAAFFRDAYYPMKPAMRVDAYKRSVTHIPFDSWGLGVQTSDDINQWTDGDLQKRNTNWNSSEDNLAVFRPAWTGDLESSGLAEGKPAEHVVGIAGTHDGDVITSLRIVTSAGASDVIRSLNNPRGGPFSFEQLLPKTYPADYEDANLRGQPVVAKFEGLVTRTSDRGLHAVALAYSFPTGPAKRLLNPSNKDMALAVTGGRWIDLNGSWSKPILDPSKLPEKEKTNPYHGNFTSSPVYCFKYDEARGVLTMWRDAFLGSSANGLLSRDFTPEKVTTDGELKATHRWVSKLGDFLVIKTIHKKLLGSQGGDDGSTPAPAHPLTTVDVVLKNQTPFTLVRPSKLASIPANPAPPRGVKPQFGWNAQFMNDMQPPAMNANYVGWDVTAIDPGSYYPLKIGRTIWKPLADGDNAYYKGDGTTKYIPNGLFFYPRPIAKTMEKTRFFTSSSQDQSSWGFDLGQSGGSPMLGSFSRSFNYKTEQQNMVKDERLTIRSRCIILSYAMIVNRAVMELDDGEEHFKSQIHKMMKQSLAGEPCDWDNFFKQFGTHYPYAITYGGTCTMKSSMTESGYSTMSSNMWGISASAEVEAGKLFKVGDMGSYNQSQQQGYESSRRVENKNAESYGGSLDGNGGFSLPDNKEVPVYMDLRPIYELLSPVYFDDPGVWTTLRADMMKATDQYVTKEMGNVPWASGGQVPWASKYPELLPKKERETLEVKGNSQFILQNKQSGRYVGPTEGTGGNGFAEYMYYPGTTTDKNRAKVFTFQSADVNKPNDDSQLQTTLPTLIIANGEGDKSRLTVSKWSVGYWNYGNDEPTNLWTLELADKPTGINKVWYSNEVRIKNVGYAQYLYEYSADYLWTTSATSGGDTVWKILPVPTR